MPATVISTANAEHYTWGGSKNTDCDAWYLVNTPELNIIEELMPPGTAETPHHHVRARQFVFVLSGELTVMVEHHDFLVHAGEGLEISPGQVHQAINRGTASVRFTMTSQPPSHDDRVEDATNPAAPTSESAPPQQDAAAVTALVLKLYKQIAAGELDRSQLTAEASAALTPDLLTQAQALFQQLGEPTKLTLKMHMAAADGGTSYVYSGTFSTGDFQVLIGLSKTGQVSGFRLAP